MRFKAIFLILSVFVTLSHSVHAFEGDFRAFQKIIKNNWDALPRNIKPRKSVGKVLWVQTSDVWGTQPRFAYHKVQKSIVKHPKRHATENEDGFYTLKNNGKQSLYPYTSAIEVIECDGPECGGKRYLIVDGHHRWETSIFFAAPTVPILVKAKFKSIQEIEESGYLYAHDKNGRVAVYAPDEIKNDPNLYLARLITWTVQWNETKKQVAKVQGEGESFLILKFGRGIARQEFVIADLLRRHGIIYDEAWGDKVPDKAMEEIASILKKADWAKGDERVMVFKKPQNLSKKDIALKYLDHLRTCNGELSDAK